MATKKRAKKKMGAPTKAEDEKRKKTVALRLTEAEYEMLQTAARRRSLADFAREIVLDHIEGS